MLKIVLAITLAIEVIACTRPSVPHFKQLVSDFDNGFSQRLAQAVQMIDSARYNQGDFDSLANLNNKFVKLLISYRDSVFYLPDTLDYDFIYVVKSKDKNLCIVSWDTRQGGTMIEYASMIFWKKSNGVGAKYLADSVDGRTENT